MTFRRPHFTPPRNRNVFQPDHPTRNLTIALAAAAIIATPFAQLSWVPVKPPPVAPPQAQPYNPNLFTNPKPVVLVDWGTGKNVPDPLPSIVSSQFNPCLFSVAATAAPFVQSSWAPAKAPPVAPPQAQPYNPNLFPVTAPFQNADWSANKLVPDPLPTIVSSQFNPNLFTNPKPFVPADWGLGKIASGFLPTIVSSQFNPNLFTVAAVAPFVQVSWASVKPPPVAPPQAQPFNPNLFTVAAAAAPFQNVDWSANKLVPGFLPTIVSSQFNPNLFTNPKPFVPADWGLGKIASGFLPSIVSSQFNPNLFTVAAVAPFVQASWAPAKPLQAVPPQAQPYNPNLFTVAAVAPFAQLSWAPAKPAPVTPPQAQPFNPNLFFATPFAQYFWPVSWRRTVVQQPSPPLNLTIAVSVNITVPQGNVALSSTAPSLDLGVNPPQGNVALSPTAPTVATTANRSIVPPQGNVALSPTAPTSFVSDPKAATPPHADLLLSTLPVQLVPGTYVYPGSGNVILSPTAPILSIDKLHLWRRVISLLGSKVLTNSKAGSVSHVDNLSGETNAPKDLEGSA